MTSYAGRFRSVVRGLEDATVVLKRSAGNIEVEVEALRRAVTRPLSQFSGVTLQGDEAAWNFDTIHFADADDEPKVGDELRQEDGTRWAFLYVMRRGLDASFQCLSRKVRT